MRRFSAVLSLSVALLVSGCISDSITVGGGGTPTSAGGDGIPGSYPLRTVNGSSLPYTWAIAGTDTLVLLDDVLTLTAGGTWTEIGHVRQRVGGVVSSRAISDRGTYTSSATKITFTSTTPGVPNPVFEGAYRSPTLTFSGQSYAGGPVTTAIYQK